VVRSNGATLMESKQSLIPGRLPSAEGQLVSHKNGHRP
jgi:hypothetical protein